MLRYLCLALLVVLLPELGPAVAQDSPADKQLIYVPVEPAGVDCSKLFDALSGELHWVAGSITAFSRSVGIKSDGLQYLTKEQTDELVARFPETFSYQDDPTTSQSAVAVDVDQLASVLSDKKSRLRQWLANAKQVPIATLSKVESTWPKNATSPRRVVVVMAGLHGIESTAEAIALKIHERTFLPTCVFGYPNDAPIAESAGLLVLDLQDLHREYPESKITLVTHSMGGLVSRAAIELEQKGAAERSTVSTRTGIDQLIQVCPPNHGSALAEYGPLLEGAEQVYRLVNRNAEKQKLGLFRSIIDGFNEATTDITPGSKFLTQLNAQERNPQVNYSIVAGNDGPLRPTITGLLGNLLDRVANSVDTPGEIDRRVRDVLDCDELQNGRGDGVVSLESARLEGVTDFEVLPIHHLVWNEPESEAGQKMMAAISSRIGVAL